MDEFDKIKELSDDIMGRKEPFFEEEQPTESDETEELSSPFSDEEPVPAELSVERESRFKWHLIGLGAFICLLSVVVMGFFLFGDDTQSDKVITISPTPEPVRVKPDQTGGVSIPDQDKLIYNRGKAAPVKVEKLFPEPEKPVLPEIMIAPSETVAVEVVEPEQKPVVVVIEETAAAPKKEVLTLAKQQALKQEAAAPVQVAQKPVQEQKQQTKKQEEFWRVQLLSTQKKASAEKAWADILKKQKALLSDMSHDIVPAEIAGKGTFYRVQAGRFGTRAQAAALCDKLKAQKQECVPVKGASK